MFLELLNQGIWPDVLAHKRLQKTHSSFTKVSLLQQDITTDYIPLQDAKACGDTFVFEGCKFYDLEIGRPLNRWYFRPGNLKYIMLS